MNIGNAPEPPQIVAPRAEVGTCAVTATIAHPSNPGDAVIVWRLVISATAAH